MKIFNVGVIWRKNLHEAMHDSLP